MDSWFSEKELLEIFLLFKKEDKRLIEYLEFTLKNLTYLDQANIKGVIGSEKIKKLRRLEFNKKEDIPNLDFIY